MFVSLKNIENRQYSSEVHKRESDSESDGPLDIYSSKLLPKTKKNYIKQNTNIDG